MYVQGTIKSVLGYLKGDPQEIAPMVYLKTMQNLAKRTNACFFKYPRFEKFADKICTGLKQNPEELLRKRFLFQK